ncbi:ADP-ribosylglycohydrolase family protein [Kitasatospora sp. NPDC004669]|uniref:ADP-ribosylglycohydrolase family protein n=1 Tax=Kitasatospora sp. NPDC004669 TaxID=3154555 RepID=UPI0033A83409
MSERDARAAGTVLGSAVGDALGRPYGFGPAGALAARFPPGPVALVAGGGPVLRAPEPLRTAAQLTAGRPDGATA